MSTNDRRKVQRIVRRIASRDLTMQQLARQWIALLALADASGIGMALIGQGGGFANKTFAGGLDAENVQV